MGRASLRTTRRKPARKLGDTDTSLTDVYSAGTSEYFSPALAAWPDLAAGNANINPPRNGMDRSTGKLLQGWDHVQQSMSVIFMTPFHQRVLRRWVGSFVPRILGESIVAGIITRFYWAIISAIDLWEPDYRITQVLFMGAALQGGTLSVASTEQMIRSGRTIFRQEGVYYPRGHLGDFTPYQNQDSVIIQPAPVSTAT